MPALVSVSACPDYQIDAVRQALRAALDPLGGMARFVRPGMKVLLKPNLLSAADPAQAITTHPTVVQAVAGLVTEAGGTPLVADGPAGSLETGRRIYGQSALGRLVRELDLPMLVLEETAWRTVNGDHYFVALPVLEADLVINLPKLKTHAFTLYTGAVKNLFGVLPGTYKQEIHCTAPRLEDFSRRLVDILELVQPGLTLMDAVVGQEGMGPGPGGTPRPYGYLAASQDAVALDAVFAAAMGYPLPSILHLQQAAGRGLGIADPQQIERVGPAPDLGEVAIPRHQVWYSRAPGWLLRSAARVYPRLTDEAACQGCGLCAEVCPQGAITVGRPIRLDRQRCIRCYCCVESCPEGIVVPYRTRWNRLVGWFIEQLMANRP